MRLFGKVDGTVDRFDRAEWLTPPFDLAFSTAVAIAGPFRAIAADAYTGGSLASEGETGGSLASEGETGGSMQSQGVRHG
jgi:hypothetical protein